MYYSLNDLIKSLSEMYIKEIAIPKMIETPYFITAINLKNQQFYFEFYWNIRSQRCFLSVFRLIDGKRYYYIKNRGLINGINLTEHITELDWEGLLYFENVLDNREDDYTINDINEKFVLKYYTSK